MHRFRDLDEEASGWRDVRQQVCTGGDQNYPAAGHLPDIPKPSDYLLKPSGHYIKFPVATANFPIRFSRVHPENAASGTSQQTSFQPVSTSGTRSGEDPPALARQQFPAEDIVIASFTPADVCKLLAP